MSGQSKNLTSWALELARRASTEQGRLVRNYGAALRRGFDPAPAASDSAAEFLRFGLGELEIMARGSLVAGLLYCDALVTSLQRSNDRFESRVLKIRAEAGDKDAPEPTA